MGACRRACGLRAGAVAVLLLIELLPRADRPYTADGLTPAAILFCWLLAAGVLWATPPSVVRPSRIAAVGALFDTVVAWVLASYPEVPSPLAGATACVATVAVYEAREAGKLRLVAMASILAVGSALRLITQQPVDGYLLVAAAAATVALAARWYARGRPARPAPAADWEPPPLDGPERDARALAQSLRGAAESLQRQLSLARSSLALRRLGDRRDDPHALAARATRIVAEELGLPAASLWRLEPDGRLTFLGAHGGPSGRTPTADASHLLAKVAHTGAQSVTEHPSDGARDPAVLGRNDELGGQVVLPLTVLGEVHGVLCLHTARTSPRLGRTPPREYLECAESIAMALRQHTAEAESDSHRLRLEVLYEIARTFEAGRPIPELVAAVLDLLARVLRFENAAVLVLDPASGKLRLSASRGEHVDLREELEFERGRGISAWVAENRRSLVIPDVHEDPRWGSPDEGIRAFASYPLLSETGETIGVLNLSARVPGVYGHEEQRLLQIVASQLALTVRRADLYARLELLAVIDPSTGIHNERFLPLALDREVVAAKAQEQGRFALVLVHPGRRGERIRQSGLHRVAHAARETLMAGSTICRFESERIAIVLPGLGREEAREVVAELQERCGDVLVTAGSAEFPGDGLSAPELLSAASVRLGTELTRP
jgi:GAF domain-containing protein